MKIKKNAFNGFEIIEEHRDKNGKLHRVDGPAVVCADGSESWCIHGRAHRTDGPSSSFSNGLKRWCINGKLHREDGPAIVYADGTKDWYLHDKQIPYAFTSLQDLMDNHPEYLI
jgi:hypothetical protein